MRDAYKAGLPSSHLRHGDHVFAAVWRTSDMIAWRLVAMIMLSIACVDGRAVRAKPPREVQPSVADTVEIHAPDDYLGKNWQAVSVITPLSSNRRTLSHKTGQWQGMQRRRGMITWMKKYEPWPFETPKRRFTVRIMREDPAGIMLTLAKEGKLKLGQGTRGGKEVISVSLPKPKPWWRPF